MCFMKKREEETMHHQEIFQVIVDNYAYEYLVINRDFSIIESSSHVRDLLDVPQEEKLEDIFSCMPELIGLEDELENLFFGLSDSFRLQNIFKSPHSYIHLHIHPGKVDEENPKMYRTLLLILEDVTERVNIEQKIYQEHNEKVLLYEEIALKNEQLKCFNEKMQLLVDQEIQKNLEKQKLLEVQSRHAQMGEMIGMITHQWKQPLNTLSMIINGLQLKHELDMLDSEAIEGFIEKLQGQIHHMNQTVQDFQHFFNPSKGVVPFNLKETIDSILSLVSYEYSMHNISIKVTGESNLEAYGFPNEYAQVVLSLLKNAKDAFIEHPCEEMRIDIHIKRGEEKESIVTISDNAGGIPEEKLETIFNRYMTTKEEGSGLGLNIAKHIIEHNMKGKLLVKNTQEGASFSLIVPTKESLLPIE